MALFSKSTLAIKLLTVTVEIKLEEESNHHRTIRDSPPSEMKKNVNATSQNIAWGRGTIKVAHTNKLDSLIIIFYHPIFIFVFLFSLKSLSPAEIASKGEDT